MRPDGARRPAAKAILDAALLRNAPSFARVLATYRYASVLLTSAFYLAAEPAAWAPYKAVVVAALAASAVIVTVLLNLNSDERTVAVITAMETLGISLLLVPTGGADSPYLWYALNPVLAAACYLKPFFCWSLLGIYCVSATVASAMVRSGTGLLPVLRNQGAFFLVFVLSTLAMQLLAQLVRKKMAEEAQLREQKAEMDQANARLELLNGKLRESADDLLSLYRSVDDLALETDGGVICDVIAGHAARLSKSPFSCFISAGAGNAGAEVYFHGESPASGEIARLAQHLIGALGGSEDPAVITVCGRELLMRPVRSASRMHGLLGIAVDTGGSGKAPAFESSRLGFTANLCGLALERAGANEVETRLMIAQERNRIAEEIHDSVCQRLFSITCSAHSLQSRYDGMGREDVLGQLALIAECAKAANQEIRLCVYGLSDRKRNVHNLFEELEQYLWSYARLNGIVMDIDLEGDDSDLGAGLQKTLHRIVRESCGNAARHGKCGSIGVHLHIRDRAVHLRITDDGSGFEPVESGTGQPGVGLKNMRAMAERHGGTFRLESRRNAGTTVTVRIPLDRDPEFRSEEAAL